MGKKVLPMILVAVTAGAVMLGCSGKKEEPAKTEALSGKPVVAVDVLKVSTSPLETGVEVVGSLAAKFETLVRAEIKSRVTEVYVTQWVPVVKGQQLAKSDTRDIETALSSARSAVSAAKSQEEAGKAQAQIVLAQKASLKSQEEALKAGVIEAEVGFDRAEREYQRVVKLMESGLATRQALDEAGSARDGAKARVEAAKAQSRSLASQLSAADAQYLAANASVNAMAAQAAAASEEVSSLENTLGKAVVKAPMNGIVAERFVNVGDLPGDTPLFKIVDNRVMDLTVTVPMRDQASVKPGQEITFTTDALPGETFSGKVMFINPSVNAADRSVGVSVEVGNPDGKLKGGMFVKGRIMTGGMKDALLLPRSALSAWDVAAKKAEVLVVTGDVARKRAVATAETAGEQVRIASGVNVGDAVIVRGGFGVKDGDKVAVSPNGAK